MAKRKAYLFTLAILLAASMLSAASCTAVGQILGPQAAAQQAFEQWAQGAGIPYRDVTFQTVTDDGTYATVRIVAYLRETAETHWLEKEAEVECRNVGGEWRCDQWMYFQLTAAQATTEAQEWATTQTAEAQRRTLTGKIAFVEARPERNVFVINANGSDLRQLTSGRTTYYDPSWCPDGTQLAVACDRSEGGGGANSNLCVMNADGSDVTWLTNQDAGDQSPSWSPDCTTIAFDRGYERGIYLLDVRTLEEVRLMEGYDAAWSPDGTRLAVGGSPLCNNGIVVVDTDGQNPVCPYNRLDERATGLHPAWSPDGLRIAFQSPDRVPTGPTICITTVNEPDLNCLSESHLDALELIAAWEPSWSPDGEHIVFAASDKDYFLNLYIVSDDWSEITRLTYGSSPDWTS